MYSYIIIGMTGQGKSHFTKSFIKSRKCFVFDVNNEYPELSTDVNQERAKDITLDREAFINACANKRGTICVFEEATGFFSGKVSEKLTRLVIGKRHTQNVYVFLFHSINRVPPFFMELANFVVLFKTADQMHQVEKKYPSLLRHYLKVKKLPQYGKIIINQIEQ